MSKKQTSPESSTAEQANEGSDSVTQQDDNAKSEKLTSLNDTMMQYLPNELIECILIKTVAMEVKDTCLKLARSVWKEKADLVIRRLGTVCSQWNIVLTTDFFRKEIHRILDGIALKTIRVDILHKSKLKSRVSDMAVMNDLIFLHCLPKDEYSWVIRVYDRNNITLVKAAVIPLPGMRTRKIAGCSVSNCLYIMNTVAHSTISILRITKVDEHRFDMSPLISDLCLGNPDLSVSPNGSLILSRPGIGRLPVIRIYDTNGSLQHVINLSPKIVGFSNIIPKPNGNLVLVKNGYGFDNTKLTEIDVDGTVIRQSSLDPFKHASDADIYGRVLLSDHGRLELLDSEFNPLNIPGQQLDNNWLISSLKLHYNSARNEIVTIGDCDNYNNGRLTILRFREE